MGEFVESIFHIKEKLKFRRIGINKRKDIEGILNLKIEMF